ncbi:MAG: LysM peptidoglycan-binding domain-containing protein [Rikenellaceae bacterium]
MKNYRRFTLSLILTLGLLLCSDVALSADVPPVAVSKVLVYKTDGNSYYVHTVKRRQTIYSIAKAYGVSVQDVMANNPEIEGQTIKVRQELTIPTQATIDRINRQTAQVAREDSLRQAEIAQQVLEQQLLEEERKRAFDFENPTWSVPVLGETFNVVMMLPFGNSGGMDQNSTDFLNGTLLALDELKSQGARIDVRVISTPRDTLQIKAIVESGELDGAHLVVGPIYPDNFGVVAQWAAQNKVVAVSPLTQSDINNPYVVQFPANVDNKYDAVRALIQSPDNNVVIINPDSGDLDALNEFKQLARSAQVFSYNRFTTASALKPLVVEDKKNVILLPASLTSVEEVLSKIAALNAPIKTYDISVVGTSRWRSLVNMNNYELMYKTQAQYPNSYYAGGDGGSSEEFYREYVDAFSSVPTLFSMRGYDVMVVMYQVMERMGENALQDLSNESFMPLQTPYSFVKSGGSWINTCWVMIEHTLDYNIKTY